jgi:hypothetical protein
MQQGKGLKALLGKRNIAIFASQTTEMEKMINE